MDRVGKIKSLDATRIPTQSKPRGFRGPLRPVKTASWSAPPISSANSAIRIICARPMHFIASLKRSG